MDKLNEIGFANFWSCVPAFDLLSEVKIEDKSSLNLLLLSTNDINHILKTVWANCEIKQEINLNFYIHEPKKENLARILLFLHLIHDREVSIRERTVLFMELYGNTMLSPRTEEYLYSVAPNLVRFITSDKKYQGILGELVDISNLAYKERDEIFEIIDTWSKKFDFDIAKYRNDRLRYHYRDRYDVRENLVDWDLQMNFRTFAPVIQAREYNDFRESGLSFDFRSGKYTNPNKTLSSYVEGKTKKGKDSCMVRGFWGDIVNSPFVSLGLKLDSKQEEEHFYAHQDVTYLHSAQEITEFNLLKILFKIDRLENYNFKTRKTDEEKENETGIKEVSIEEYNASLNAEQTEKNKAIEVLKGFKHLNCKFIFLSGEFDSFVRKKKFQNFFDLAIIGFHSKNFFAVAHMLCKKQTLLYLENNAFMTAFNKEQRQTFKEEIIKLASVNNWDNLPIDIVTLFKFVQKEDVSKEENTTPNALTSAEVIEEVKVETKVEAVSSSATKSDEK